MVGCPWLIVPVIIVGWYIYGRLPLLIVPVILPVWLTACHPDYMYTCTRYEWQCILITFTGCILHVSHKLIWSVVWPRTNWPLVGALQLIGRLPGLCACVFLLMNRGVETRNRNPLGSADRVHWWSGSRPAQCVVWAADGFGLWSMKKAHLNFLNYLLHLEN